MQPSSCHTLFAPPGGIACFPPSSLAPFLFAGPRFFSSPLAGGICPAQPFLLHCPPGQSHKSPVGSPLLPEQPVAPLPLQFGSHLCDLQHFTYSFLPESVSVEGVVGRGGELDGAPDLFVGHSFLTLLLTISPSLVYRSWGILLPPLWLFTLLTLGGRLPSVDLNQRSETR